MFSFLKSSKVAKELVDKRTALIENAMLQMLAGITLYVSTLGKTREAVISVDSDGTFSGVIGKTPFEIKVSYPLAKRGHVKCNASKHLQHGVFNQSGPFIYQLLCNFAAFEKTEHSLLLFARAV
jgi:hypothetical protein